MSSKTETRKEVEDVVIDLNEIQSEDVVDAARRRNQVTSNVSFYNSKKSAAEGMMDISLLTANANQLKFILCFNQTSRTFYAALSLIVLSLVLQVSIGILLIFRVSFDVQHPSFSCFSLSLVSSVASKPTVKNEESAQSTSISSC